MPRILSRSRTSSRTPLHALFAGALLALTTALHPAAAQDMQGSETARRALHVCASCHGADGHSKNAQFPHLAGQSAQYTAQQLKDFREQRRGETDNRAYMWGVSALLDDATIEALANHYAAQTPTPGKTAAKPQLLARGKAIFEAGIPQRKVAACASCHGANAEGAAAFPRLAGQHAAYLERQLDTFSTRLRPHGVLMRNEVAGLRKDERRAVAAYLQSL